MTPRRALLLGQGGAPISESESRYRRLLARISALVFELDADGTTRFVNDAVTDITGLQPADLLGRNWWNTLVPEEARGPAAALLERCRTGDVADYEVVITNRKGAPMTLAVNSANHYGPEGQLERLVCFAVDITERKYIDEALRQSEAQLRELVERREFILNATGTGLWEQNLTTGHLTWSDTMEAIHGLRRHDFPATREAICALLHADDQPVFIDAFDRAVEEGTGYHIEFRTIWPNESVHWIESKARLIHDPAGGPLRLIGVNRDITERKLVEMALVDSERAYRSTFDAGPVGIAHVSIDGRWLRANRRLNELLGYSSEELAQVDFHRLTHPDDVAGDVEPMRQMILGTRDRFVRDKRYRRRDGSYVWTTLNVSLHRNTEGQPQYFISMIEDITERRTLEEQFRQSQKMEAVGQLAGGVAHDFNNLLTAIIGFSELSLGAIADDDPIRPDLQEILKAGQSAASLTRQLLAFSRRQVLQFQILDLSVVVCEMEPMLRRLIGEAITLATLGADTPRFVSADKGQIEQVLMNLVVNARDAMPAGGTLSVEVATVALDEAFVASHPGASVGPHVLLAIKDTGVGMDQATLGHLFEPFFTTKERGKGTGLGLATVYGVVKHSLGYVDVISERGRGTTFTVYLPESSRQSLLFEDAAPLPSLSGTETILLVEDQAEVRLIAREMLTRSGYTVLATGGGDEAIAMMQTHNGPIHLLLTDIVMPDMSGPVLARKLSGMSPTLRVLYMSGYTDNMAVDPIRRGSGLAFIQKPFTRNRLLERVRELLDPPASVVPSALPH